MTEPVKRICSKSDLALFPQSEAYKRLHSVIGAIVEKVKATSVPTGILDPGIVTKPKQHDDTKTDYELKNKTIGYVVGILSQLDRLVSDTPPIEGSRRFGNIAFRDWHEKANTVPLAFETSEQLSSNLAYYFFNSFGSALRLDYGSGHELSFVAFLGGLIYTNLLDWDTVDSAEVLVLFAKYYDLVRRLILVYNLEPAGLHGVWGLDDHFHFIYILGAAQFNARDGKFEAPPVKSILAPETLAEYKLVNFYVNAVAFIFCIKLGPFHEHLPVIYDIHRSVSLWAKVLSGLLKMYEVEVFGKFPVVQHFWFSKLYPWVDLIPERLERPALLRRR